MSYLILIRHSLPEIQPEQPAAAWQLSEEGWQRCRILADHLQPYGLKRIFASQELKAGQTAQAVAEQLGIPWASAPGLEEHHRALMHIVPRPEFRSLVARLLQNPQEMIFGEETGAQARERFSSALQRLLQLHPNENLGVVTHGTVLSLWIEQRFSIPAFSYWEQLGLPAFLVIRRESDWTVEHHQNIPGGQAVP